MVIMASAYSSLASLALLTSVIPVLTNETDRVKYTCTYCDHILRPPVMQSLCGHRFCKACGDEISSSGKYVCCPGEEEECKTTSLNEMFMDICFTKDMMKLEVYCTNRENGCHTKCQYGKLQKHLESCDFVFQHCPNPNCIFQGTKQSIQTHVHNDCLYAMELCHLCNEEVTRQDMQKGHVTQCENKERPCTMREFGCEFVGKRKELVEHESNLAIHMKTFVSVLKSLKHKIDRNEKDRVELKDESERLKSENEKLKDVRTTFQDFQSDVKHQLYLLQEQLSELLKSTSERLGAIDNKIRGHTDEITELTHQSRHTRAVDGQNGIMKTIEASIRIIETKLTESEIRFRCLETVNYSGELIWKIVNYSERKATAKLGRTLSLYSQPFYTKPFGYKLCARIYLNGDGLGKNTHLSLFIVVMKGECDAILNWPLKARMHLSIIDQQYGRDHISDVFKTDTTSSSFRRPLEAMNIASGCPKFASHLEVENDTYIKQDTLFVRAKVDII